MKKIIIVMIFFVYCLAACEKSCEHSWQDATCLTAKTCKNCNLSEGTALDHLYEEGLCIRCREKDPTYLTKQEQMMKFLQSTKKEEVNHLGKLILENVDDDLKKDIQSLLDECFVKIDETTTITLLENTTNEYLTRIYELIPTAHGLFDFSNLSDLEKQKVLNLLDEYIFRNKLVGIPINPNYSLNLNSTSKEQWIEFFGINGSKNQVEESNYWPVKPLLSNDYFIKGLNLCIDKSEFSNVSLSTSIDYQKYNFYEYNLDLARKYFAASLEEMIEKGVYEVGTEIIELSIEIAFDSKNEKTEKIYETLKNQIETAFNDQLVTNGQFLLKVDVWYGEIFGSIFYNKNYCGCFDISYDKLTVGSIDKKPYIAYSLLSSSKELSYSLTLNYSLDTNDLDDCLVYNGYRYTYDALLDLLNGSREIDHGKLVLNNEN